MIVSYITLFQISKYKPRQMIKISTNETIHMSHLQTKIFIGDILIFLSNTIKCYVHKIKSQFIHV